MTQELGSKRRFHRSCRGEVGVWGLKQNGRTVSCFAWALFFLIQQCLGDALTGHAGTAPDLLGLEALSCKIAVLQRTILDARRYVIL